MNITEFKKKEMNGELHPEPLLTVDKTRFVLFPIKHDDVSEQSLTAMHVTLSCI